MRTIQKLELRVTRTKLGTAKTSFARIVTTSVDVAAVARELIADASQEVMLTLLLDARNRIVAYTEVARGPLTAACVHRREVFRVAVQQGAVSIIVVHNHPSNDATPSESDLAMTAELASGGKVLGIPMLDHVIVTLDAHHSLRDAGWLAAP